MSVWIIILQWYINRLLRSTMMIESFFIFYKKNISFDVSFYFLSCVIVHVNILLVISYLSDVLAKVWHWAKTNYQAHWYSQIQLPVIRQKGQSQNGCFKKTKHVKFSEKRTFLTPRSCAHPGLRNVCFSENLTCFVFLKHLFWDSPFYYRQFTDNHNLWLSY